MYDSSALPRLADLNLAEANREQARWLPPAQIVEHEQRLLVSCGTRFPAGPWNSAMPLGGACDAPDAFLPAVRAHFAALGRGFSLYTRAHLDQELEQRCREAGLELADDIPGMALSAPPAAPALGAEIEIVRASSLEQARGFIDVCGSAYESLGMRAAMTQKLLSSEAWLAPPWEVHVLYAHGELVAGAMLLYSHGIAGVYWVATLPAARGRGFAAAVTQSVSGAAFAAGARAVVLQASRFGAPVYWRIGFREITRYRRWLVPLA